MRLAYLSIDEVNQYTARQWADRHSLYLDILFPRDALPAAGSCAAMLYDLDHLPRELRLTLLIALLAQPGESLAAVHSYHVPEAVVAALRSRGVIVHRRLEAVLARLTGLLVPAPRSEAVDAESTMIWPRGRRTRIGVHVSASGSSYDAGRIPDDDQRQ